VINVKIADRVKAVMQSGESEQRMILLMLTKCIWKLTSISEKSGK